jgi:hypothetical protein
MARVMALPGYTYIPDELLVVARSLDDEFDRFDDKWFHYVNGVYFNGGICTSNPGAMSLLGGFKKRKVSGSALVKADEIYYDVYEFGYHNRQKNGGMPALRQRVMPAGAMKYHRDGDMDKKSEANGIVLTGVFNTNFHFVSYQPEAVAVRLPPRLTIGAWGEGCIVANQGDRYYKSINHWKAAKKYVTLAIFTETK